VAIGSIYGISKEVNPAGCSQDAILRELIEKDRTGASGSGGICELSTIGVKISGGLNVGSGRSI